MRSFEISGFHGTNTPATILVLEYNNGAKWYCVKGSPIANKTYDPIEHGVNIETLSDCATLLVDNPINTIEELIEV